MKYTMKDNLEAIGTALVVTFGFIAIIAVFVKVAVK